LATRTVVKETFYDAYHHIDLNVLLKFKNSPISGSQQIVNSQMIKRASIQELRIF